MGIRISTPRARASAAFLLLLGGASGLFLQGCFSSCRGAAPKEPAAAPVTASAPSTPSPTSPLGSPAQTPSGPPPAPAPPVIPEATLTLDGMDAIREGMSLEDVAGLIGPPSMMIAGAPKGGAAVYRWNDRGMSFLARFEQGRLIRKNVLDDDGERAKVSNEEVLMDRELYESVKEGMSYEEVMALIGMEAQPVSKSGTAVSIYRWTDARGSSFTARFENGVLARKNGFFSTPAPDSPPPEERKEPPAASGDGGAEEEYAVAVEAPPPPPRPASVSRSNPLRVNTAPKVRVAGAARAQGEEAAQAPAPARPKSYRPRAKLPDISRRLRAGSYEIRVSNTSNAAVEAAVISDEGGLKMSIQPGGRQSVKVGQGTYVLYFIYGDEPDVLHRGGDIPISQWLTDMEVFLVGETYDVQVLDRSRDRQPTPRRRR